MQYIKLYEGFLDLFKKQKNSSKKSFPSKEKLMEMINTTGAYFKTDIYTQAIKYNPNKDRFLLLHEGKFSRFEYTYFDLEVLSKEKNAWIDSYGDKEV